MKNIQIYDYDEARLSEISDEYDYSIAHIIETLLDNYLEDVVEYL